MTDPLRSVTTPDLVLLDVDAGSDKEAVIGRLASTLADAGRATDGDGLTAAAMAREGAVGHRPARRNRDPALPVAVCRHRPPSGSPG